MPIAHLRGVEIAYEVVGTHGPWITYGPGGRFGGDVVRPLAAMLAQAGYRCVVWDRRNTGSSDVMIAGEQPEYEIWADDLYGLMSELGALPGVIGGSSSGCRMALQFALKHPDDVLALFLTRITGGEHAARRLANTYYSQYIEMAAVGGMAAVCTSPFFRERCERRPVNRDRLMAMDPQDFIRAMTHWRSFFLTAGKDPVLGTSAEQLRSIRAPTCIIPGNDWTHPPAAADAMRALIPNSELHHVMTNYYDMDLGPTEEWYARYADIAAIADAFVTRTLESASVLTTACHEPKRETGER
jgi:pimeloyl-ACP methyl ester carboxylesterase